MGVSVHHLRILILFANVSLAVGLLAHYGYSAWYPKADFSKEKIDPPSAFRMVDAAAPAAAVRNPESGMIIVAEALNRRPPEPIPERLGPGPEETKPPEEEIADGGILAQDWEYVWGMFFPTNPLLNRVQLARKQPDPARPAAVNARTPANVRARSLQVASRTIRGGLAVNPNDIIYLQVGQRYYKNDDLQIEFYIHSADAERFVYWVNDPKKKYSLPRVSESPYVRERPKGLRPDEDPAAEPPKPEERKIVYGQPVDFENRIEEDYREKLDGGPGSGVLKPRGGAAGSSPPQRSGAAAPRTIGPPGASTGVTRTLGPRAAGSPAISGGAATAQPQAPTAEEMRQLQDTLKDPKIPEDARKQLQEALRGPVRN
jgi:hypothetical protein